MLSHRKPTTQSRAVGAAIRAGVCLGLTIALGGCTRSTEDGNPAGPRIWVALAYHAPGTEGAWLNIWAGGRFEALGIGPQFYEGNLADADLEELRQRTTSQLLGTYNLDTLLPAEEAALSDDDAWYWVEVNRQSPPFGAELSGILALRVRSRRRSTFWMVWTASLIAMHLRSAVV